MSAPDPPLSPNAWLRWELIRGDLTARDPRSVLELGMGQGAVGARLARSRRYVGVEPDDGSRRVARERLPHDAVALQDLSELDPSERFDVVCAFEVLEHIRDDVAALRAWSQHLAPDGALLLSVPAHQARYGPADELVGHFRRYGRADLHQVLEHAGLRARRIDAVGFPLGYVLEWGRDRLAAKRLRADVAPDATPEARSASSGRTFQPPAAAAMVTRLATAPFRWLQRPFRRTNLGTGWFVVAERPST